MIVQRSQQKWISMKLIIFNFALLQLFKVAAAQHDYEEVDYPQAPESEEPAEILSVPEEFSVEVGGDITFPCEVQHLGTKQLVFQFNSFSTPSKERLYFAGNNRFSTNHRLARSENGFRLSNIRRSDAGFYACKLYDPPRQVVHKLKVLFPAKIRRISPERQQVVKGDSVTLQCEAEGNPEANIQWSKKGGRLPSGEHVEEGLSITLANVDRHEAGTFQCTASNGIGKPSTADMVIEVEFRPEIITEESILHTGDGDDAKLVCIVHGHPTPEVSWLRGNHLVASDKHLMTHDGEHRHSLIIRQVQEEDFGEYTCTAKNTHGTAESTVSLTGLPKVPRLTSSPSGGEEDSYTLTWETESFSPIVQYRLKYRKYKEGTAAKDGHSWNDSLYLAVTPTKHSQQRSSDRLQVMAHAIKQLDPATDYQVLVSVENKFGWSEPSVAMIFHTRKESSHSQPLASLPPPTEIADGRSASTAAMLASSTMALLFAALLLRV